MAVAIVHTRANSGICARAVTIEVDITPGLPRLSIVGLPETAVKESKDRVRSALINCGFTFPSHRITINLAPADLPKEGGRFDLPIALGILATSAQIPLLSLADYEFVGELALSGGLRPITGILPFALATRNSQRSLICPELNREEAAIISQLTLYPAADLLSICAHLTGEAPLLEHRRKPQIVKAFNSELDMAEIKGQHAAKRTLEIAAAGRHSLLMSGPPGTGKTMLASRLPSLLPPLSEAEALETAAVRSICGKPFLAHNWRQRPFRAPHHTASSAALVGGGQPPKPGEISLSHHGVLFLDEFTEFNRHVLETLREPLESGHITISRAAHQAEFPAKLQLVAAMNPCPCGYLTDPRRQCRCGSSQIDRYQQRLSGPLLDRIDLHIEVAPLPEAYLFEPDSDSETSTTIRERVMNAWQRQLTRSGTSNAYLTGKTLLAACQLTAAQQRWIIKALSELGLSARGFHRMLRVARTIADLAESDQITDPHLHEAFSYRNKVLTAEPKVVT